MDTPFGKVIYSELQCCIGGFESRSGQTKDYKIGIYFFYVKYTALRKKSKDWLALNQDNVSGVGQHVYPWTIVSVS